MIILCAYVLGLYCTLNLLAWDGDNEPEDIALSAIIWPIFWLAIVGLRLWYAWADREYWRGK